MPHPIRILYLVMLEASDDQPTGFKEWQLVCEALARGEQTIILRKGGIAEGRDGFQFKHPEFHLFPTLFHEQANRIRPGFLGDWQGPAEGADKARETITINLFARIDFHKIITDWSQLVRLEAYHIWTEDELRARFTWSKNPEDSPGISLACVRVYRLVNPWTFPNQRSFGGCRSWIKLPQDPPAPGLAQPVLSDEAFETLKRNLTSHP